MIYGDPYKFAIWFDVVEEYASGHFREGLFHIIIDGVMFPSKVHVMPVNYLISELVGNFSPNTVQDSQLHQLDAYRAFRGAQTPRHHYEDATEDEINSAPIGIEISTAASYDIEGWFIYLFFSNDEDVLVWSNDCGKTVYEKRLPRGTVEMVIHSLPSPDDI